MKGVETLCRRMVTRNITISTTPIFLVVAHWNSVQVWHVKGLCVPGMIFLYWSCNTSFSGSDVPVRSIADMNVNIEATFHKNVVVFCNFCLQCYIWNCFNITDLNIYFNLNFVLIFQFILNINLTISKSILIVSVTIIATHFKLHKKKTSQTYPTPLSLNATSLRYRVTRTLSTWHPPCGVKRKTFWNKPARLKAAKPTAQRLTTLHNFLGKKSRAVSAN